MQLSLTVYDPLIFVVWIKQLEFWVFFQVCMSLFKKQIVYRYILLFLIFFYFKVPNFSTCTTLEYLEVHTLVPKLLSLV